MKIRNKKEVIEEAVEEVFEEAADESALMAVNETLHEKPKRRKAAEVIDEDDEDGATRGQPSRFRRVLTKADISDECIYGVHKYNLRSFGTSFMPASGLEIRNADVRKNMDYGVIGYFAPNTKGLTVTGTFHHSPKGTSMLKVADDFYIAIKNWDGDDYVPPEKRPRQKFLFSQMEPEALAAALTKQEKRLKKLFKPKTKIVFRKGAYET